MPVCDLCQVNIEKMEAFIPHYAHCLWKKNHPACGRCRQYFDSDLELRNHHCYLVNQKK